MLKHVRIPEKDVIKRLLDHLQDVNERGAAFQAYCDAVSELGFNGVILVSRSVGPGWEESIQETTFPTEWIEHYLQSGYQKTDPARRFCFRTNAPFFWSETFPHFRKKELTIFSEAKEFGLESGMAMPVFDCGMMVGAIGLSSETSSVVNPEIKPTVSIAAQIFLSVYHQIVSEENGGNLVSRETYPPFTKREIEILSVLATGMSNPEISDALHVSLSAVEYHLMNIFVKLGVQSRVGAVVRAIKVGLITPE